MAKTYLDQIVEYPAAVIQKIATDKHCVSLLVNKDCEKLTEEDYENALGKFIYSYQYVDPTAESASAYICVEIEIDKVRNKQIKGVYLYVTVACHKEYMKLNPAIYKGMIGNRRDNIVRYVDKLLNNAEFMGIGALQLDSIKTVNPSNGFTARELLYVVPDFNIVELDE